MSRYRPGNPARRPSWRKAGRDEGFRVVGRRGRQWDVRRLSRHAGEAWIPKAGWVRFRWSRAAPPGVRSYRVTINRAGRWHIDRGVADSAALSTGELLDCPGLAAGERVRLRRMQRTLARAKRSSNRRARVRHAIARLRARESDRNVRQKAGLNREILRSGWGLLVRRLEDKAPGRVQKVIAAFTSQRCSGCGQVDAESPESQARFACTAGGFAGNADVNAARNIAAGHAVTARGGFRDAGPANREPQLLLPSV